MLGIFKSYAYLCETKSEVEQIKSKQFIMKTKIIYDKENRANLVLSEVQAMLMKVTSGMDISYLDNGKVVCVGTYDDLIDALRQHRVFLIPIGFIHPDNEDIKLCDDVIYSKIDCNDAFPLFNNLNIDVYFFSDDEMWKYESAIALKELIEQAYIRVAPLSEFNSLIRDDFNIQLYKQELKEIIGALLHKLTMSTPNNINDIMEFVFNDICSRVDLDKFTYDDVRVGVGNWIESK